MLACESTSDRGLDRDAAFRLMPEALPLAGYGDIRADLPGWEAPEVVH